MALTSHLLALPAELRQEILTYVLAWPELTDRGGNQTHESYANEKGLYCGVCRLGFRKSRYRGSQNTSDAILYRPRCGYEWMTRSMAILQTCRQIYFEGTDLLYNKTLFVGINQYISRWGFESTIGSLHSWVRFRWANLGTTADCQNLLNRLKHVRIEQRVKVGDQNRAAGGRVRILRSLVQQLGSPDLSLEMLLHFEVDDPLCSYSREGSFDELTRALEGLDHAGCRPYITIKTNCTNHLPGDDVSKEAVFSKSLATAFCSAGVPFTIVDNTTMEPR